MPLPIEMLRTLSGPEHGTHDQNYDHSLYLHVVDLVSLLNQFEPVFLMHYWLTNLLFLG